VHGGSKTFDFAPFFGIFNAVIVANQVNKKRGDTLTPQSGF
jgi:hypothetical protein